MLHLLLMTLTSAQAQLQEKQQPVCDTNLNLCCGSTLGQKSCAVVVPLICLDLVNVTSVDGVTGSQDVHDVLRLRCRTLQSKHNCRQHSAATVIKWPPSMDMRKLQFAQRRDNKQCATGDAQKQKRNLRPSTQCRCQGACHDGLIVTAVRMRPISRVCTT